MWKNVSIVLWNFLLTILRKQFVSCATFCLTPNTCAPEMKCSFVQMFSNQLPHSTFASLLLWPNRANPTFTIHKCISRNRLTDRRPFCHKRPTVWSTPVTRDCLDNDFLIFGCLQIINATVSSCITKLDWVPDKANGNKSDLILRSDHRLFVGPVSC